MAGGGLDQGRWAKFVGKVVRNRQKEKLQINYVSLCVCFISSTTCNFNKIIRNSGSFFIKSLMGYLGIRSMVIFTELFV